MKTYNFNQTGGFKLTTETLASLQNAYKIYSGVAKMAGDKAILAGCEDLNTSVSDGFVVINGETLEFKGALKQATVIIKEEVGDLEFEDGSIKPFETYRYATFGFSPSAFTWTDFKRVPALNTLPTLLTNLETSLNNKIDALTNAIGYLKKGNLYIGDVQGHSVGWSYTAPNDYQITLINMNTPTSSGGDDLYRVTFNEPFTTNNDYVVFITFNYNGNYVNNNDVVAVVTNKLTNGFDLSLREFASITQDLSLDFIIFKK